MRGVVNLFRPSYSYSFRRFSLIELDLTIFRERCAFRFVVIHKGPGRCARAQHAARVFGSYRGERYTEHGGRDSQAVGPKTAFHWYLSLTQPPTVRIHGSAAKRAEEREREREKDRPTYITIIQHTHKNPEDLNAAGSGRALRAKQARTNVRGNKARGEES